MTQQEARGRAAVVGAGAIGLAVASALLRAGRQVIVCGGRIPVHRIEIAEDGAARTWPVAHTDDPSDIAGVDTVVLAVKAHQTDSAAEWLRSSAGPSTTVLVAQNGIEHRQRVAPHAGESRIVPAVVYLNVERVEPGRAILRRVGTRDLAVPDDAAGRTIAAELEAGGMRVALEGDFATAAWRKLLVNITANPLTALTGRRAEVIRDPAVGGLARRIMDEALAVARAEGAALTPDDVGAAMDWLLHVPDGATTSMRQDRLAGRPLEYDALTGAVVRAAGRHGLDVPVNRMILALIAAIRPERETGR
ncbi:MAG: 2-dehydropantoate 2-reductase [Actinomyces sp.]|jgi:2-dehydropantoate 2-reductase|nr:2-dehydropantoate 2-reductase [Actinomyces sp.]MCI1642222.1 2-dehydropantoate 2-reductase [Actinomyces sp.]MCI1662593.1 2-dehydropantoate 2-reductase [Actinomyces sp.]MCI1690970.1 2-dehydropantoate 2-reductase [Actinomyces sp.]MCI1788313.1 2-dehydropantoate 2-reductase [Actinomyces sp.]